MASIFSKIAAGEIPSYKCAESDNVLLVCKKEDSSALVRKYVNEIQMKKGDDFV